MSEYNIASRRANIYDISLLQEMEEEKNNFEVIKIPETSVIIDGEEFCFVKDSPKTLLDYYDIFSSHGKNASKIALLTMTDIFLICIRETSFLTSDILTRVALTADHCIKKINEQD